jgi:hypothetical protein
VPKLSEPRLPAAEAAEARNSFPRLSPTTTTQRHGRPSFPDLRIYTCTGGKRAIHPGL